MNSTYIPIPDARIRELEQLAARANARIHIVRRVRVNQGCDWQEAINLAGPNTPSDWPVRKTEVSDQYQPISNKNIKTDIVLFNYSNAVGNWDKVTTWGKESKLNVANPREVFAIADQKPDLDKILGQNPIGVITLNECSFESNRNTCFVLWQGSNRTVRLFWVYFPLDSELWFAFREPSPEPVQ